MNKSSNFFYIILIVSALLACSYSYFKTSITSPFFPSTRLTYNKLEAGQLGSPISSSSRLLKNDTSDRKLSPLYEYTFRDRSKLLAVMVRVRKRDDFKIETYGLLTKGIDPIYIKSPSFINTVPFSMYGLINGKKTLQTCLIPGTTELDQVNVQLFPLLAQADKLAGSTQSLLSKLLGTDDRSDYSCLVLSYQPTSFKSVTDTWKSIVRSTQVALMN